MGPFPPSPMITRPKRRHLWPNKCWVVGTAWAMALVTTSTSCHCFMSLCTKQPERRPQTKQDGPPSDSHCSPWEGAGLPRAAQDDSRLQRSDTCTPSYPATRWPGREVPVLEHEERRLRAANPVPARIRPSPHGCQGARRATAGAQEPHPLLWALVTTQPW